MGLSATIQSNILKCITAKEIASSAPSIQKRQFWVGLCISKPDATTGPSDELPIGQVHGVGYHRQVLVAQRSQGSGNSWIIENYANKMTEVAQDGSGNYETHNNEPIMFPKCDTAEGWGSVNNPIRYAVFFDDETSTAASHFIGWGKLRTPQTIAQNQVATFDVGELKLTFIDEDEEEVQESGSGN